MRLVGCFILCSFLAACAHYPVPRSTSQNTSPQVPMNYTQSEPGDSIQEKEVALPANPPVVSQQGDLRDDESDMAQLPLEFNEKVTRQIEYFQSKRGRKHMARYLARSSRYLPKMKEILRKHGLPEDLVYIALIESGFNPHALSSARAVGYWQFIRGTGRRYGLQQNYYLDDRRDFIASTEAAAKYLKALYNLFGSWYLAIASYNVGENRIKNLVMKYYTRNFWDLAKKGRLPRETIDYVPRFLAARLIAKHPEKYGFDDVVYEPPLSFKEVTFSKGIHMRKLASNLGLTFAELKRLNPSYKRGIIPFRKGGATVRVPLNLADKRILAALQKSQSNAKMKVYAAGQVRTYRIRRGDTLSHIAQRFGTSIRALRQANRFNRRATLYPGKKIKIPTGRRVASSSRKVASKKRRGEKTYRVRRGDNLYAIAKKFGVSIAQLKKRNKMGRRSLLQIGKVLVIPGRG